MRKYAGCEKRRVLIVDDNKLICWGLEKIMSSRKWFVKSVHSGKEALTEISTGLFHWVLLDIYLPDVNGLDLLKEVRALSPRTKVVVMSGNCSDLTRQKALKEGAMLFVSKPFTSHEIKSLVDACFLSDHPPDR